MLAQAQRAVAFRRRAHLDIYPNNRPNQPIQALQSLFLRVRLWQSLESLNRIQHFFESFYVEAAQSFETPCSFFFVAYCEAHLRSEERRVGIECRLRITTSTEQ